MHLLASPAQTLTIAPVVCLLFAQLDFFALAPSTQSLAPVVHLTMPQGLPPVRPAQLALQALSTPSLAPPPVHSACPASRDTLAPPQGCGLAPATEPAALSLGVVVLLAQCPPMPPSAGLEAIALEEHPRLPFPALRLLSAQRQGSVQSRCVHGASHQWQGVAISRPLQMGLEMTQPFTAQLELRLQMV